VKASGSGSILKQGTDLLLDSLIPVYGGNPFNISGLEASPRTWPADQR